MYTAVSPKGRRKESESVCECKNMYIRTIWERFIYFYWENVQCTVQYTLCGDLSRVCVCEKWKLLDKKDGAETLKTTKNTYTLAYSIFSIDNEAHRIPHHHMNPIDAIIRCKIMWQKMNEIQLFGIWQNESHHKDRFTFFSARKIVFRKW